MPDGGQIFSEAQSAEMWSPAVVVPRAEFALPAALSAMQPDLQTYGLGWFVDDYHGHIVVEHGGAVLGAVAMQYLLPEKGVGISVAINSEDAGARRAVLFHVLDHHLGLPTTDWIGTVGRAHDDGVAAALASLKRAHAAPAADPAGAKLPPNSYAGTYRDPWYGEMTISTDGRGRLLISFDRSPGIQSVLEPAGDGHLRTRWTDRTIEDAELAFVFKEGTVTGVTMAAVSPLADFSWEYNDLRLMSVRQ